MKSTKELILIKLKEAREAQIKLLAYFEDKLKPHGYSIVQRYNWVVKINEVTICALDVNGQVICDRDMSKYTLFEEKTAIEIKDNLVMKNCFGNRINLTVLSEKDFIREQIASLKQSIEWSKELDKQ